MADEIAAKANRSRSNTRRKFVQSAGILGASTLASPTSAQGLFAPMKGPKPMGIALVGLGQYAMGELAPALQLTKQCKLTGLVTGTPEKRARYGQQYAIEDDHIYDYQTYDRIAENDAIDIIYVVLPNSMHAEYSIRAAEAGKHVICEKPMGLTVAECDKMIDACKANDVTLNVGYRLHFEPHHQVVMNLGQSKQLGRPLRIRAECCQVMGDPNQWRLKKALAGGGAVYDIGIYCIQAARYAMNAEPVAISAQEFKTDPVKFAEVDETVTFQLEFPSGVVANCICSYNAHGHSLQIGYSKRNDLITLDNAFYYRNIVGRLNGRVMDNLQPVNQQALQMDGIAQSIREGTDSGISGKEGRQDMKIIEALYASIDQDGKKVKI